MGCCLLPGGANRRPRTAQQHRRNRAGTDVLDRQSNGGLVYPDSDKVGIWVENDEDKLIVPRSSATDYFSGEA